MSQSRIRRNTEDDGGTYAGVEAVQDRTQIVSHSVGHNIHDDRYHPEARMKSPSVKSWYSMNEGLSPRASAFYSDLYTTDVYAQSTYFDPDYLEPSTSCTVEDKKASTVTVFPIFKTSVQESDSSLDSESKYIDADVEQRKPTDFDSERAEKQPYIKRLKEIYRAGPPGEGQQLWRGLRSYWREKQTGVVFETCQPYRTDETSKALSSESMVDEPAADPRQRRSPTTAYVTGEGPDQQRLRHDSVASYGDISRTSREVPVKIRRTVLELDTNKPLPRPPRLSDAPIGHSQRARGRESDLNKPLPRTPFPCFPMPPKPQDVSEESPVAPEWPPTHTATVGSVTSDSHNKILRQDSSKPTAQTTWLKPLATKTPDPQPTGKSKPSKATKAHNDLKAKISRPFPMPHPTVTSDFSPRRRAPHPDTTSEKARGKQDSLASPTWLDKLAHPALPSLPAMLLARKRPASEESFMCRGVEEMGGCGDGVGLRPEPLFTGGMFEGRYCDEEDGVGGEARTGRWI